MVYTFDRSFKCKLFDDDWKCFIITNEEAEELKEGDDETGSFRGQVDTANKCLFINEEDLDKETIMHELFHIRIHYLHLSSTDITVGDFEEITAELIAHEIDKLVKIRNKLYNRFRKLQDNK